MGQSVTAEEERDNPSASSKVVLSTMFKRACSSSPPMVAGPSVPILAKQFFGEVELTFVTKE